MSVAETHPSSVPKHSVSRLSTPSLQHRVRVAAAAAAAMTYIRHACSAAVQQQLANAGLWHLFYLNIDIDSG
jgi:hypothetical protein